jgi:hypothetical protein
MCACVCECMKPLLLLNSSTDLLARKVSVSVRVKLFKFTCSEFHCVESHDKICAAKILSKSQQNGLLSV